MSLLPRFLNWRSSTLGILPRRAASLRYIVDRIRNSLQLDVVLQTAVEEVGELLEIDRCLFFWYFHELQRVQVVGEYSQSQATQSCLGHYSLHDLGGIAPLVRQGQWLVGRGRKSTTGHAGFLLNPSVFVGQRENLRLFGQQVTLLVPVLGQEDSIGFIVCLVNRPRRWSAADLDFMQAIAQQLEIAIRQAQLYECTQKQAQREKLVNHITTQTRLSLDVKKILPEAIAQLLEALAVDRCLVHLVESVAEDDERSMDSTPSAVDSNVFRRKHLFEACREPFPPSITDFDTNGPITRWVIEHRRQVVISDITRDGRIGADNAEYQKAQIKSSLVVPVQTSGQLYAILYLNQCNHIRHWSRDDQNLAQAVANQLAISIQQAHLYHQTRQQAHASTAQARHLAQALEDLKRAQAQLIQSEKMSSLGKIVAGVAHELNNPVSFIYGNIPYVERYMTDLLRLVEHYESQGGAEASELQTLEAEIEWHFLRQDLPRLLQSMKDGSARIREIVTSLRNFARLDEASCKVVDIHDGLNSTLAILSNQLHPAIAIHRHYSELPLVECFPSALNQVFMNLIINAAEALEDAKTGNPCITITTTLCPPRVEGSSWVQIRVSDNGCGILPEIQSKIFDPFFTTKEVGRGNGLGLAVSYQTVVQQHQGSLKCESTPGKGSTFIVEIPTNHMATRMHNRNRHIQADSRSVSRLVS
ncbi:MULTISPECIES: GAF domain-containing protein [unclassified Leptolyngbya]|uniref:GAF domain-containing sensor histidine kinase n=1 Tax=unclassified Leptolyngbya TaxID=2650499 RepID=UPI0016891859|nr:MULTISPECIES: GAF domain-containing protein [unclassified Leptolyngbya]MBD1910342.1 GAF domain-containing protein [Leptolyngbya sp. FACHB-8]MBD2154855.1 GAF domain-containing protein [Leptolyngbya sp. FACHB-16]